MASDGERDNHQGDDSDCPNVLSTNAFNEETRENKKWSGTELNCRHTDFQSVGNVDKTREKVHVCETCQQIASSCQLSDADLARIVDAWPKLSPAVRLAIVKMVEAVDGNSK